MGTGGEPTFAVLEAVPRKAMANPMAPANPVTSRTDPSRPDVAWSPGPPNAADSSVCHRGQAPWRAGGSGYGNRHMGRRHRQRNNPPRSSSLSLCKLRGPDHEAQGHVLRAGG
jgi:hypothetical protein